MASVESNLIWQYQSKFILLEIYHTDTHKLQLGIREFSMILKVANYKRMIKLLYTHPTENYSHKLNSEVHLYLIIWKNVCTIV